MTAKRLWGIGAPLELAYWSLCEAFVCFTPQLQLTLSLFPLLSFPWPFKLLTMILFHFIYFCELLQYIVFGLVYRQGNQVHVAGGIKKAACFMRAFSLVKTKQRTITAITKITEAATLFFPPWSWLWWDLIQQRWGGGGGRGGKPLSSSSVLWADSAKPHSVVLMRPHRYHLGNALLVGNANSQAPFWTSWQDWPPYAGPRAKWTCGALRLKKWWEFQDGESRSLSQMGAPSEYGVQPMKLAGLTEREPLGAGL